MTTHATKNESRCGDSQIVAVHGLLAFATWFSCCFLVPRLWRQFSDLLYGNGFPPADFDLIVRISFFVREYSLVVIAVMLLFLWLDAKVLHKLRGAQRYWLASFWSSGIALVFIIFLLFVNYAAASPGLMMQAARGKIIHRHD